MGLGSCLGSFTFWVSHLSLKGGSFLFCDLGAQWLPVRICGDTGGLSGPGSVLSCWEGDRDASLRFRAPPLHGYV